MSGQNWWRRLGLVMCIAASVGVVSGCEFNMEKRCSKHDKMYR